MSVQAVRVPVTDAPTPLNGDDTGPNPGSGVLVKNVGSVPLALGGSTVTFAQGYPFPVGAEISVDLESSVEVLYAVADTGQSGSAATLRTGV